MAKWTLPEGKIYTQADLDAAVAAALREAARIVCRAGHSLDAEILALIPDAGKALDRALAAERRTVAEDCAKLVPVVEDQGEWLKNLLDATRAAIRHGYAISAQGGKT